MRLSSYFSAVMIVGCVQVRLAVEQVQKHKGNDKSLWRKICANDYRRCAVIESYETIKFVLREIVRENTTEYQRFLSIYEEIDMSIRQNGFTTTFKLKELPKVHEAVLELVKDLLAWPTHNDPVKVRMCLWLWKWKLVFLVDVWVGGVSPLLLCA